MKTVRGLITTLGTVALAITLVAAGLGVCLLPSLTQGLAHSFAREDLSPFSREQLVRVADATRDFSFASHDETALYKVIYDVNAEHQQTLKDAGTSIPTDCPQLDKVTDQSDLTQLRSAFAGASESYCYSADSVSHLDDCNAVLVEAMPTLVGSAIVSVVALVALGVMGGRRSRHSMGAMLLVAGMTVVVCFVALGLWAVVDFNGLFTAFHKLFFSQGNWQFPYDSLLICALPTEFWMSMGAIWLGTSTLTALVCIVVGKQLRR